MPQENDVKVPNDFNDLNDLNDFKVLKGLKVFVIRC